MVTMDTSQQAIIASPTHQIQYWKFPLRAVPMGNSLINLYNYNWIPTIYSTSRRSIGSPGNYTTTYKITVLNNYGSPLRDLGANILPSRWSIINTIYTDSMGTCSVPFSIKDLDSGVAISDRHVLYQSDPFKIDTLPIRYSDTDTLIIKTIKIPATQYLLTVNNPDSSINIRCLKECSNTYSQTIFSGLTNPLLLRMYPSNPACALCFAPNIPQNSSECLATWKGRYIDTAAIIHQTITIAPTGISQTHTAPPANTGITLSGLCENNREVRIVVSSSLPAFRGSLSLYAINGKLIKSLPVAMNGSGTSTVLFRFPGPQLSTGKYLCKLTINNSAPATCQITIP